MEPQDPAFEPLIEDHLDYARAIAWQLKQRLPPFVEFQELAARALLALVQAARHYDPNGVHAGVPFKSFARHRISGEVREFSRRRNLLHSKTLQLFEESEVGRAFAVPPESEASIEQDARDRQAELVRQAVRTLDPQTQALFDLRYTCDKQWDEIASDLGISQAAVYKRRRVALEHIRNSTPGRQLKDIAMKQPTKQAIKIDQAKHAAVVDELGDIEARLAKVKSDTKADSDRAKELEKEILSWTVDLGAAEERRFHGNRHVARVTARKNQRVVIQGGYKKIAVWLKELFFDHCSMTLKSLEVLLNREQLAEVVSEDRTGPRSIEIEPILKESLKKAA